MSAKGKSEGPPFEIIVNGRERGSDLSTLSFDHEWEHAVFGETGIPENLR